MLYNYIGRLFVYNNLFITIFLILIMQKLKSSGRTSKRYLLIEGIKESIEKAILDYVGILGFSKAAPYFVKKTKKGIILAINRSEISKVRGSFAISKDNIKIIKVSGTLKGLNK